LVIHNEEKLLPRCLESIKDVVDEIIVAHDGPCKDKSLEIARNYGAKVFECPFVGVAEPHRPFTYREAKGDWIFQIDADETLSLKAREKLRSLVDDSKVDGYAFWWPYFDGEECFLRGPFSREFKHCLYRKSSLFFLGLPQEYPRTYGLVKKLPGVLLEHRPSYNNFTPDRFRNKWLKWADLQAKQICRLEECSHYNIRVLSENFVCKEYEYIRKHPWLSMFKKELKLVYLYLSRGLLFVGPKSWFVALLTMLYHIFLHYYIWKYRRIDKYD
jgi:glycosyltransferase involved in cell wall biosynthesis